MLFRITVKQSRNVNSVRLDKGMTAEISFQYNNPLGDIKGKELIRNAFMNKYGIDLKKACAIDSVNLDVQKIS